MDNLLHNFHKNLKPKKVANTILKEIEEQRKKEQRNRGSKNV